MKTTKRTITICIIFCLLLSTMTACAGGTTLNGTYKKVGGLSATYTFDRKGNVTISKIGGVDKSTGTYSIKGNLLIIDSHHTWVGIEAGDYTTEHTFEKQGKKVYIDGVEYLKVG